MKLLVDMIACQTHSRFRGIGRYSLSLVSEMAELRGTNEMTVLADALYPECFEDLRQAFTRLLPAGSFLPYYHEPLQNPNWKGREPLSKIAETLIEQAYQLVAPNIGLTPSLFDGWGGEEQGLVPLPEMDFANHQHAVVLYDIIPYIFHKQYLDPDPPIKKWYLERMNLLQKFDLLLAISESTQQDAINILGIDPDRVVNISGAASSHFRKLELTDDEKQSCLQRFGISRPFVLYIGGNDFRKNMDGALRAFAKLPSDISASHQLVLNDVGDEAVFRSRARKLGLADADLVIAKRITDKELAVLYNLCKLFVFPSLYEGFGLPILEAMSCGAPVLASNNSSLPEVAGRADVLFDVTNDQAVADAINKVLTNDAFRAELAAYAPERAKQFSWENSAKRAWDAIEGIQHEKKSQENRYISVTATQKRMRIAYVSPLPPQRSGVASYSSNLLPYLAPFFDIDLFVEPGLDVADLFLKEHFSIYPWTELLERRDKYDTAIYQMGNSEFHIAMLRLLQDVPGIVVCHDFYLSNLPFVQEIKNGERGIFYNEIDYSHGLRGVVNYLKNGIESTRWVWPLNWKVLKNAQEIIVHSEHQRELLKKFYTHGWQPNLRVIKQVREIAPLVSNSRKKALRKELGLDPNAFIYCSFGLMAPTKLNNPTIKAFSQTLSRIHDNAMLIFVGDLEGGEYGLETLNIIKELKLSKKVRITPFLIKEPYEKYLACTDVAIQLRTDSRGETSRAVLDCMAYGLPLIINAHGSLNDYDAEDVVKLSEAPSIEELSQAMVSLQSDKAFRLEKGRRARNLIIEQHDPKKVAAAYADVITGASQIKEQKFFAPLVDSILELGSPDDLLRSSARYAAENFSLRCQPRILIDVTCLEGLKVLNSKQQVVAEFIKELFSSSNKSIHIELVQVRDGRLLRACRFVEMVFELPGQSLGTTMPILVQPGDILLMIDSLLTKSVPSSEIYGRIRQMGGKVVTRINEYPASLLETAALESDMFICGSQEYAEDTFISFKQYPEILQRPLDILFPCPEKITQDNCKGTTKDLFQIEAGERSGLVRMVKVLAPAWNDAIGWMQVLLEGGLIFAQPPELFTSDDTAIKVNNLIKKKPGDLNKSIHKKANKKKTFTGNRKFQMEVAGERIFALSRTLSSPKGKEFSIVVQEDATDGITTAILKNAFGLPQHYHMLFDLVRPKGYVLDLGAHIGTFAIMAGMHGYHVTAVEASPRNAALMNESIRRNGLKKNVRLVEAAVSDRAGSMDFIQDGPYGMVSNTIVHDVGRTITVQSIPVDDLIALIGWQNIDVIKMDIEGSEVNAIKGMSRLLSSNPAPILLFESNGHTLNMFGVTPGDLFSALEGYGYQCYHYYGEQLYPITGKDIQLECVSDCIAAKQLPKDFQEKWKIASSMDVENKIKMALGSLNHPNDAVRAYIGRALQHTDKTFLGDVRISSALDGLKKDPKEAVRKSISWWIAGETLLPGATENLRPKSGEHPEA